jgi:predicted nucleic acid-binding protein
MAWRKHATAFVVMRERGLTEALSADKHFEQAGFRALLLSH